MHRVAYLTSASKVSAISAPIVGAVKSLIAPVVKSKFAILFTNFPLVLAGGTFFLVPGIVANKLPEAFTQYGFELYRSQSYGRIKYSIYFWKHLIFHYPENCPIEIRTLYTKTKLIMEMIKKLGSIVFKPIIAFKNEGLPLPFPTPVPAPDLPTPEVPRPGPPKPGDPDWRPFGPIGKKNE